jgi:hypothetical protein
MSGKNSPNFVGFDEKVFWAHANGILHAGTSEMLQNRRHQAALEAAFERMDGEIQVLVERFRPTKEVQSQLCMKMKNIIKTVGNKLVDEDVDTSKYWETERRKVSGILLKAIGSDEKVVPIDRTLDQSEKRAIAALCKGNFSADGARRIIGELAAYDCKSIKQVVARMSNSPNHMELLRFLREKGTENTQKIAAKAMDMMVPAEDKPVRLAKIIDARHLFGSPRPAPVPLRH